MKIDAKPEGQIGIVLRLEGELDASSSVLLDEIMSEQDLKNCKNILIDCTELQYISSAGLGVFMSHMQHLEQNNVKLIFFCMTERVRNVFQILGLDSLTTIVSSKSEALILCNE